MRGDEKRGACGRPGAGGLPQLLFVNNDLGGRGAWLACDGGSRRGDARGQLQRCKAAKVSKRIDSCGLRRPQCPGKTRAHSSGQARPSQTTIESEAQEGTMRLTDRQHRVRERRAEPSQSSRGGEADSCARRTLDCIFAYQLRRSGRRGMRRHRARSFGWTSN
jgi:hypothetical protein